jgi:hypothetical protein
MEIWSHDGKLYELTSGYVLPEDAWSYELTGLTGPRGTEPFLSVSIPDATPIGPFTPRPAERVIVHAGGGVLPWPILEKVMGVLDSSGDLVDEHRDLSAEATALPLTLNTWAHGDRQFVVNHHHDGSTGSWRYELYEVDSGKSENNYIEVRIPDVPPESGPFVPMPSKHVTLTMHGSWAIPWPVFRRLLDAVQAAGDIVESTADTTPPIERP